MPAESGEQRPTFASILRGYRHREGLSQADLAQRILTLAPVPGVSETSVAHWEAGRRVPRPLHLALMLRVFQLPSGEAALIIREAARGNRGIRTFLRSFDAMLEGTPLEGQDPKLVQAFLTFATTDLSSSRGD